MNLRKWWWQVAPWMSPSRAIGALDTAARPYYYPWLQRRNDGVFAIELNNSQVGFFALLNWYLFILFYCERRGLTPYVELTSRNYLSPDRGNDWFKYYFENLALRRTGLGDDFRPRYVSRFDSIARLRLPAYSDDELTLEHAAGLVRRNIGLRPAIADEVEQFRARHFAGRQVLGVHFRGTDKKSEAPRVNWEFCRRTLCNYLDAHPEIGGLFVTSDEAAFVDYIQKAFADRPVYARDDHFRSDGRAPLHLLGSGGDNYLKGVDALVNCLLLSHCAALVRSSSFLSAWASVFNPTVPVVLLNEPHAQALWFPEIRILERTQRQYLPDAAQPAN